MNNKRNYAFGTFRQTIACQVGKATFLLHS